MPKYFHKPVPYCFKTIANWSNIQIFSPFSPGVNFLTALEKDEQKITVEQQIIKSNNSLGVSCSPQKPSEGCSREFIDITENTASVLMFFREKEAPADIAAIFREIKWTWTVILHSMGET